MKYSIIFFFFLLAIGAGLLPAPQPASAAPSMAPPSGWVKAQVVGGSCDSQGYCGSTVRPGSPTLYEYKPDRQSVDRDFAVTTDRSQHSGYPTYISRDKCHIGSVDYYWSAGIWHHGGYWTLTFDGTGREKWSGPSNQHWAFEHNDVCQPPPTPPPTATSTPLPTPQPNHTYTVFTWNGHGHCRVEAPCWTIAQFKATNQPNITPTRIPSPTATPSPTPSPTPLPPTPPVPGATFNISIHSTLDPNNAEEIERFLNEEGTEKSGKKTNKALYTWMKREVKGLYGQCFQLAFDTARKAERALQHELGDPALSYLQFSYLAGKEGLLVGERLYLDIKRMDLAYQELNQREYELTKHVSLLQVDPLALIQLRATGRCTTRAPEELFDMDGPGHYFRRIKSVALSIPCVAGPYASVSCTLTLLKSSVRKTPVLGDAYARADANDARFEEYFGSMQSVVTSSAQNDSGLFEANQRDERYLPFEYAGAISEWQLELPADPSKKDPAQFDYATISAVVLHVRYTARGGKFQRQAPAARQRYELALTLRPEHYPFWRQERLKQVRRVDILARSTQAPVPASLDVFDSIDDQAGPAKKDSLVKDTALGGLLAGKLAEIALPASPTGAFKLYFDNKDLEDLWLAVTWGG